MNPQEAFNNLVSVARQMKLTAAEHDVITQSAILLKPIIEKHVEALSVIKTEAGKV